MSRRRRRPVRLSARARLVRAALGASFAGLLLFVAEVALRLTGISPAYQADRLGGWRFAANLDDHQILGANEPHDFRVSSNDAGLRTHLPREKTPGVTRIAVMGDSKVFGWGVGDDEGVGEALEQALGPGFEVLNAGQPGYSTTQAAWLFEETVVDWQPDLTIVWQSMHDFNRTLVSDREHLHGGATPTAWARVLLARHSRIYTLLRKQLYTEAERIQLLPQQATNDTARVQRVSDDDRRANFDRIRELSAAWGGELAIGLLPFYRDLSTAPGSTAQPREGQPFATRYAEEHELLLLDVRTCCGPDVDALVFPFDHGHLTAEGNRRVGVAAAPLVAAWLER